MDIMSSELPRQLAAHKIAAAHRDAHDRRLATLARETREASRAPRDTEPARQGSWRLVSRASRLLHHH